MDELLMKLDSEYIANTYARFKLTLIGGENATATDIEDREYIDFTSGIGVNSLGFSDTGFLSAITMQLLSIQHTSNLFYTLPCVDLAEALVKRANMKRVFFSNSGAEANECAIKTARKWGHDNKGATCGKIITLERSFHGRTITTLSATGQDSFHTNYAPFTEGFIYVKPNDIDALDSAIDGDVCAIMIEVIQGESGVLPLSTEYAAHIAKVCEERGILLICDEVQTGVGRTGTFLASEQFGVKPNIVTLAKGLGGGLPIGATLFDEKTYETLGYGDHGSTFGGNPVVCAGARAVLDRLDNKAIAHVATLGKKFRKKITEILLNYVDESQIEITGLGLMIGVNVAPLGLSAREIVEAGIEEGVLMLTAHDRLRLLPPLTISSKEVDKGLKRLENAIKRLMKK